MNKLIIFIIIIGLILIGCSKETKYEINGFQFESVAKDYHQITLTAEKDNVKSVYKANIREDPRTLKEISVESGIKEKILNANQIYITMNPNANYSSKVTIAGIEIKKFISNPLLWGKNASAAFSEEYEGREFQIKGCEENENETVILLRTGDKDKIYYDKCVIVQGKDENGMIRSADRLVLSLLGVY